MSETPRDLGAVVLAGALDTLRSQKRLAERAVEQISFEQMRVTPDANSNSVAVIMKHLAGNMRSRWTDFLTTDGQKPWRGRDSEFVDAFASRDQVFDVWERGWGCLFDALEALTPADLIRPAVMRGHEQTAVEAILAQLSHYAFHVGQIVALCRSLAGDKWRVLSIPRGESDAYDRRTWGPVGDGPPA